ncbi:MAG: riboflavin synthase [Balneolaceae bacterium]
MFTGIVSETGTLKKLQQIQGGQELTIACSFAGDVHIDESIAVNGVCLTAVDFDAQTFRVQCVQETLRKTSLGSLKEGMAVNLERSLTLEKAIEGHIVQGHVDTVGAIERVTQDGADLLVEISYPEAFDDYIVDRGSIAVDGISLTVARTIGLGEGEGEGEGAGAGERAGVGADGADKGTLRPRFVVAIIPYTWDFTNLKEKQEGDLVNLEFDMFGKYIIKYMKKLRG